MKTVKQTHIRKISPQEWAQRFQDWTGRTKPSSYTGDKSLPDNYYSIPGLLKQSRIFFIRDMLSKLSNRQYIIISFLGAPLLALLLAYFTKYTIDGNYIFSENKNLPSYMFMCVITSLFLGLIISAEEIVKDRKILKRETFLNLSWFSYLNSKVAIMFLISAIQTISFILIGNFILEIKGMDLAYWLVLFTTSCFANMLGLNISSAFSSVITIYILIPFILIPELLFSGVIVKFDQLHKNSFSSIENVPIIGDLMTTRWAFEALAVEQFKNNKYERNFYIYKQEKSQNNWYSGYLLKTLNNDLQKCFKHKDDEDFQSAFKENVYKINYYTGALNKIAGVGPFDSKWKHTLLEGKIDSTTYLEGRTYLNNLDHHFNELIKLYQSKCDSVSKVLEARIGTQGLIKLKEDYYNEELEKAVLDQMNLDKTIETGSRIIQKYEPGYMKPLSRAGRAHFFAPYKQIGNITIDTFWFNLLVLWIVTFALFVALYYNLLQKLINVFDNLRFKNTEK